MGDAGRTDAADSIPAAAGVPADRTVLARTQALDVALREVEAHVEAAGSGGPPRLFALVLAAKALAADPTLRRKVPADVVGMADADPHHLLSVEQEGFATDGKDLDLALGRISWPETVDGAVVVVERIIVPPAAEAAVPDDPTAALAYLAQHPDRQDVRLAVGVLRADAAQAGTRWSLIRTSAGIIPGPDLVPSLAEALARTFD